MPWIAIAWKTILKNKKIYFAIVMQKNETEIKYKVQFMHAQQTV